MEYIFNSKRKLFSLIILMFSFEFVILDETVELKIQNFTATYSKATNYYFSQESEESLPNYIKIELEGQNEDTNYIISYYKQDSSFKETNQLSQSISGKAFIWLNKAQIQNGFYLNVECSNLTCEYSLNITLYEKIMIYLGQPYNYYVTEENKNTTFTICIQPDKYDYYNILNDYDLKATIWAKGNYDITSELKVEDYAKHPKYNAYLFYIPSLEEIEYEFNVKGTVGDLINIGGLFFDGMNICAHIIKDLGIEISLFLVKGKLDDAVFLNSNTSGIIRSIYHFDYDYEYSNFLNDENSTKGDYKKIFIRLDPYDFFSFSSLQIIGYTDIETKTQKKINIYPPQYLGYTYERNVNMGEIIGLIPMNPGKDFNYLTYHTALKEGYFKAYIYECENYPLCKLDSNTLNKSEKLLDYNSASITYNKSEYNENITSISKKQKMLLLTCQSKSCTFYTSMYTNNNNLNVILSVPYYKYIKENNDDNYYMTIKKSIMNSFSIMQANIYIYINIEVISGNISLNPKENEDYLNNNKKLISFRMDKLKDFSLKIKANSNSIYSIAASIHTDEIDLLTPNINYLLKINNSNYENSLIFVDELNSAKPNYFGFFYQNCNIEVKYNNTTKKVNNNNYFQDYQTINNKVNSILYKINKENNENNNCFFSASMYNLEEEKNSIILEAEAKYPFLFNNNNKKIKFMHIDTEKEKGLQINLDILDKSKCNLTLFLNDQEIKKFNINESNYIVVNSERLMSNCKEENQPCKINFILNTETSDNSKIEIQLSHQITKDDNWDSFNDDDDDNEDNKKDHDSEDKDNNKTLYIVLGVVGGFIIILLVVILILKCKKKGDGNLNKKIEEVFEQGDTNELSLLQKDEK